jgi:large subunit ribosomal protein L1
MAKTKQELLAEADKLGLTLSVKDTVAEITAAIKDAKEADEATADVKPFDEETIQAIESEELEEAIEERFAKAGKKSAKSVRETEEESEKEARKEAGDTSAQGGAVANIERGPVPIPRPLAERHGKKFKKAAEKIEAGKVYPLAEAVKLATETSNTKFDSTVEIHVRLGVDPKQADQNVRATVSLPNGTGKTVKVAAFVAEADVEAAKAAGADIVVKKTEKASTHVTRVKAADDSPKQKPQHSKKSVSTATVSKQDLKSSAPKKPRGSTLT